MSLNCMSLIGRVGWVKTQICTMSLFSVFFFFELFPKAVCLFSSIFSETSGGYWHKLQSQSKPKLCRSFDKLKLILELLPPEDASFSLSLLWILFVTDFYNKPIHTEVLKYPILCLITPVWNCYFFSSFYFL